MSIQSGRNYYLVNKASGTTLDLSGGDDKSIIGYELHNGDNQKWTVVKDDNQNGWTLKNVASNKYLCSDATKGSEKDGSPVVARLNDPTIWDIWPDEDDRSAHRLFVPETKFNIDLSDHGNATDGTPVTLWTKWKGVNQTWEFRQADEQ